MKLLPSYRPSLSPTPPPAQISNFQKESTKFYETSKNVLFEKKQWCLPS